MALALALLTSSCHRPVPALPIVLGPYAYGQGLPFFETVESSITGAGYELTIRDPARGRLATATRTHLRNQPGVLRVEIYREGWVRVFGTPADHPRAGMRLAVEAERLALQIRTDLAAAHVELGVEE